jgi:hypothetical protein
VVAGRVEQVREGHASRVDLWRTLDLATGFLGPPAGRLDVLDQDGEDRIVG